MLARLVPHLLVISATFISINIPGDAAAQVDAEERLQERIATEIARTIESFLRSGQIEALQGHVFVIPPNQAYGVENITLRPAAAFEPFERSVDGAILKESDGSIRIVVKDPASLYKLQAGIRVPVRVEVSVEKKAGGQGTFQLDASSACINTLVYRQVGGGIVNVGELLQLEGYEVTLDYPQELLRQVAVGAEQVTFERIRPGKATVTLRVRALETNSVQEVANEIPECGISAPLPEPAPVPEPAPAPEPSPVPEPQVLERPSETWFGMEASIGIAGRLAFDVSHHVGGPLLTWGVFGDYSFIDLGPNHESEPMLGLRAGAGWRWDDMSVFAQFPLGMTYRSREMRLGTEIVFEKNLRDNIDGRLTAGAMMVEEGDAEILLLAGITLNLGRSAAEEPEY
jgi:hypothetical protein